MDVTFRHVQAKTPLNEQRLGVCTTWLTTLQPGQTVPATVRPSTFRPPADLSVPLVLISGGIGIAPFRAYVQMWVVVHVRVADTWVVLAWRCVVAQFLASPPSGRVYHGNGTCLAVPRLPQPG